MIEKQQNKKLCLLMQFFINEHAGMALAMCYLFYWGRFTNDTDNKRTCCGKKNNQLHVGVIWPGVEVPVKKKKIFYKY